MVGLGVKAIICISCRTMKSYWSSLLGRVGHQ
jgi:hypothetical protein